MRTLGTRTRNGKKPASRRVERSERSHSAVAKLAIARKGYKEAVEQQAATAEILRALSRSIGNPKPIFDAIVENAHRLTGAAFTVVYTYDGKQMNVAADHNPPRASRALRGLYPMPPRADHIVGRTILKARTHTAVLPDDPRFPGNRNAFGKLMPRRVTLAVPLLKNGTCLGAIATARLELRPYTKNEMRLLQTFADQAVIAIENVRLFNETRDALERQTATAEILRVISQSQTDAQPVFDAIVRSAVRLCSGSFGSMLRIDGDAIRLEAYYNPSPEGGKLISSRFPAPLSEHSLVALAARTAEVVHSPDTDNDPRAHKGPVPRALGARAQLTVPLLRQGKAMALLNVVRDKPGPFSQAQIEILKTFADQAVIAIENVRLFNETKEALEQQTATSEILGVISASPTDLAPVFDAILKRGLQLCEAHLGHLHLYDGGFYRTVAQRGATPEFAKYIAERGPYKAEGTVLRAVPSAEPVHIPDLKQTPAYLARKPNTVKFVELGGARTCLSVPLLTEGKVLGVLVIYRSEVRPFSEKQIALISLFASQAVIAIENARLFNETKEALEQQTGTTEILKVISQSPTDTKPVFQIIAERAVKLCDAAISVVARFDGKSIHLVASHGVNPKATEMMASVFPMRSEDETVMARTVRNRAIVHVADVLADATYSAKHVAAAAEYRSSLGVPMMRGGEVIGGIFVARARPGLFSDKQVALLQTFADQAVIAIENVRLFNETKEALDRQTATAEILNVISRSPTDVQPVLDAVAERAARLWEGSDATIHLVDGDQLRLAAHSGPITEEEIGSCMPFNRGFFSGRAILEGRQYHILDGQSEAAEFPGAAARCREHGVHTILVTPLLREGRGIGTIVIRRTVVQAFHEQQLALVKTFADQAVIAIENVRLFKETKEALEQQTATAEILKVISASPTETQPVFEAIVQSAARLFAPCMVSVVMREGDVLLRKARAGPQPPRADQGVVATIYPLPFDAERSMAARSVIERRIIQVPDTEAEGLPPIVKSLGRAAGYRAITLVPLVKEGEGIGVIGLSRPEPGFKLTDKQLALVRTFADQAVIAIENVRLFKELQDRTEALTKSVGQLTALGQVGQAITSTLDLETVLKTIVSHAVKLTALDAGAVYEYDEGTEEFHLRAAENLGEEILEVLRTRPIRKGDGVVGRTAVTREPMQIHDTQDESYQSNLRELVIRTGRRALLAVPLMREDHIIGALTVQRNTPGPFAPEAVELLKTFATQSAMAIQNARLYREIEQKSRELETASKHKSQFLASMSHELRTPLNAILGFNEMILDQVYGEVPPDVKAPLENIQSSGKHLLRLINNVLDLAKIEAGRMELALSDYSVQDTVASVHSTLKPLAAEKGLEFVAEVRSDIPLACGDAGRLAQCLMNLAGNSLKFTKEGRVSIAVAQDNGLLRFSVTDTGIGIPADKIPNLFTEFKQTDATIASEYGGTGLGLSITKKFIEMHGGRIWVESEPGKGSTFLFEIPLKAAQ